MAIKNGPIESSRDVGLPPRPFLWTLDQVATILSIDKTALNASAYIYYEGRSIGLPSKQLMIARNIAPDHAHPEWRIAERELLRWMRVKGFKYYDTGHIKN